MRTLFFSIFMLVASTIYSQKSVYTGIYLSTEEGNLAFVQFEEDIDIAIMRCEYLTNFNGDNRLYLKMQFQVYKVKDFRFFAALPPFHGSFKEKGYNTPFNVEVMWRNKLLLNTDIYKDGVNLSVQFRHKF